MIVIQQPFRVPIFFADYRRIVESGASPTSLAERLGKAYFGKRPVTVAQLRDFVTEAVKRGKAPADFATWWADQAAPKPAVVRAKLETAVEDETRRLRNELHAQILKRSEAEQAVASLTARVQAADDIAVAARAEVDRLRAVLTRRETEVSELERALADESQAKDVLTAKIRVLEGGGHRFGAAIAASSSAPELPSNGVAGHLAALVDAGVMGVEEAIQRGIGRRVQ